MAVELGGFDLEGDVIGPLYELEGADGFVHVLGGGGEVAEDEGEGIAGEGLLEESGEFGLPEGSRRLLIAAGQREDHLSEGGEGEVDVLQLLQLLLPYRFLLVDLLTSCQVAEVQSPLQEGPVAALYLNEQLEDGVRAGALGVHGGLPDGPVLHPLLQQLHTVLKLLHAELRQALHEDPLHLRLMDP
jgi:hypothetical protein